MKLDSTKIEVYQRKNQLQTDLKNQLNPILKKYRFVYDLKFSEYWLYYKERFSILRSLTGRIGFKKQGNMVTLEVNRHNYTWFDTAINIGKELEDQLGFEVTVRAIDRLI